MKECARLTGPSKHLGTIGCQFESCPSISTAPRHISIHCRKISKYSYMLQMSVSICRFSEMSFDCIRDTAKVLIILSISFLLVAAEDALTTAITFSALIAIMFIGIGLQKKRAVVAKRLSVKYGKLWVAAEVFLFVLVGATVNIGYLGKVGAKALLLIAGALVFRMLGVFVCLLGTSLSKKERLFTMMVYTPKATVQAAIGGIPLALGFACGDSLPWRCWLSC